jgi:hypothetical protein
MVNGIPGGMAVMAKDSNKLYLIAILPKGVRTRDTVSTNIPRYYGSGKRSIVIMSIEKTAATMRELTTVLGARARVVARTGDFAAIVLQQAYQRIVGARTTVVDSDHTLVAIAELAMGAWSVDIGYRTLALFSAWHCEGGEITGHTYRRYMREIKALAASRYPSDRSMVNNAASAVFEWLRMVNIRGGQGIDSVLVSRIVSHVSRSRIPGGAPSAVYNYAPKDVAMVSRERAYVDFDDLLTHITSHLFIIPEPPAMLEMEEYEEDSYLTESSDGWD